MNRVRIQALPMLRTFVVRAYAEPDAPLTAGFQLVCTMQITDVDEAWIHGMLGVSNRKIWNILATKLVEMGIFYIRAVRAPNRVLPGGVTMPDGSLRIDLRALLSRPRDTGFVPL